MKNSIEELLLTVEKIRSEKYPHISRKLVDAILLEEADSIETRPQILKQISKLVEDNLKEVKSVDTK